MTIVKVDEGRKVGITESGREVPLPDDVLKRFLRKAGRSKKFTERKEKYRKGTASPGGEGEGFFHSMAGGMGALEGKKTEWSWLEGLGEKAADMMMAGGTAFSKGEGQEDMSYMERVGEMYQASQEGTREGRAELYKKYPKSAIAGGILGVGQDLALGGSMPKSGMIAAPIMGAGLTDVNPIEEPGRWIGGRAIDVGAGYVLDKAVGGLVNVAKQRAARKAHPGAVRAVEQANMEAMQGFKEAEASFQNALRSLPAEQQQARRIFGNRVRKEAGKLSREMSVSKIPRTAIKVEEFVNNSINASELIGTPQGKTLSNFFTTLVESRPENMGWKDVGKLLTSVEDRILVASEEELPHLLKFKEHLLEVVPRAVGEASAQRKYFGRILKAFESDIEKEVGSLLKNKNFSQYVESELGKKGTKIFRDSVVNEVKVALKDLSNEEISYLINSGEMGGFIAQTVENAPAVKHLNQSLLMDLSPEIATAGMTKKQIREMSSSGAGFMYASEMSGNEMAAFTEQLAERTSGSAERFAGDMYIEAENVAEKVGRRLEKTVGVAESLPMPTAPTPPTLQPIPEQETMGFLGNLAEKPMTSMVPKMNLQGAGGLAKAALVGGAVAKPLIAGGAAAGAGAATAGLGALKMATDPGKLGDITRKGISYFGKTLSSYLEAKYESFEDGILESPQERLEASLEIEKDPYLSNQDKAIWQTKINKGQRIR